MTISHFRSDNTFILDAIIAAMGSALSGIHIYGEEGVGKEAIVRTLYARSPYGRAPFVKINCPALSVDAGEDDRPCIAQITSHANMGRSHLFKLFHQGVLYLEAIDRLNAALQQRLLDLIRRRNGAIDGQRHKMAIFSTSTRPLGTCMADGNVLPELVALLDTVSVHIPPLRRTPERIGPLVDFFLRKGTASGYGHFLPAPSALQLAFLKAHHWPGNLRELQALVQTARRLGDWESTISRLQVTSADVPVYCPVDLSIEGVSLMPDFEITSRRMLDDLAASPQAEEMGLMDLVVIDNGF